MSGDYHIALDLIDGNRDRQTTLDTLVWSGGLPIQGPDDQWLFLADTNDGELHLILEGEAGQPMHQADGIQWLEVEIPAPDGMTYRFEAHTGARDADPLARSYTYINTDEYSYVSPPSDTHHLERWPHATDGAVLPRTLRVLVPPGDGPWSMLLIQDGNNLFNPNAPWGGWRLQEAALNQAPILLVGIDNTQERMQDYTHTSDWIDGVLYGGGGANYATFVHETVRPHLESTYPVRDTVGLMGSSLGGLISLYITQRYPTNYAFVASLSGTLGWGRFGASNITMHEIYSELTPNQFVLFVDSGGSDGDGRCEDADDDGFVEDDPNDSDNYCMNRSFADDMAEHGYRWNETLHHWWEPNAPHTELAWADRVHRPLELFATQIQ